MPYVTKNRLMFYRFKNINPFCSFARSQAPAWECGIGSSSFVSRIREAGASKIGVTKLEFGNQLKPQKNHKIWLCQKHI
jgi:hypothetical protein